MSTYTAGIKEYLKGRTIEEQWNFYQNLGQFVNQQLEILQMKQNNQTLERISPTDSTELIVDTSNG